MNCLKNSRSVLSRLLRHRPHVAAPPPPTPATAPQSPASRYYYYASRVKPAVSRPPPPPQLPRSRHYYTSPRRQQVVHFNRRRGGSRWYHDQRKLTAAVLISGGGAVAFYFGHLETVPYTNRSHLVVLSPKFERQLGESQFAQLKKEFGPKILPPLHPDSIRVRLIASEIVRAVHRGISVQQRHDAFYGEDASYGYGGIADDLSIKNRDADAAAALLGASPGKNASAAVAAQRDDELLDDRADAEVATVVGHEVGHAIARHSAEQITKNLWVAILQIVILQFIYMPDLINTVSTLLLRLPFSRRMEIEADHIGLLLLASAGYDPRVAPSVYEKLGKIGGDSALNNYLSTHPSSKKRAQLLSQASVMNEALKLYREVSAGQGTEGFL
uniref:Peptidase M48 domain-containing protein n=1 Tax=Zea mays TaxID=4577 RepID=A0A804PNT9_MAIZE